ncbi:unnamed protein product, partial [Ectocarpus sp. 8 AP-2014]
CPRLLACNPHNRLQGLTIHHQQQQAATHNEMPRDIHTHTHTHTQASQFPNSRQRESNDYSEKRPKTRTATTTKGENGQGNTQGTDKKVPSIHSRAPTLHPSTQRTANPILSRELSGTGS